MPFAWDSSPLTEPEQNNIRIETTPLAASRRMLDGSLRVRYRTQKSRITLAWAALTGSERNALAAAYIAHIATAAKMDLPDDQTFVVMAAANSWQETQWYAYDNTPYYDVTFTVEEA